LSLLAVDSFEREEYLVFSAFADDGSALDTESCEKLFSVPADVGSANTLSTDLAAMLDGADHDGQTRVLGDVGQRNRRYFEEEIEKLDAWAEDLKENLERELKELDKEIRATKKDARQMLDLDQKVALHKKAREAEQKRNERRRKLFHAQDEIDGKKEALISQTEARLQQKVEMKRVFEIRWRVV
jgi:hypothetical protein